MKAKKSISILIAGILAAATVLSASAQTIAGTLESGEKSGNTEVHAKIEAPVPGEVSYIVTIPDSVDFGTLQQPETDTDSNKYLSCDVIATQIKNFNIKQTVKVCVKDSTSTDGMFYIAQKGAEAPFKIKYDVYNHDVNDENIDQYTSLSDDTLDLTEKGYHLCSFGSGSEGTTQKVALVLNQRALYNKNINDIAGDYSGTMVFHTSINTLGA